jgi:dsDNA-specific endonuclease/ATPase MutS2
MKTELDKVKTGLKNAHSFLQKAIDENDTQNETYFFEAVFRYSELVDKLERQNAEIERLTKLENCVRSLYMKIPVPMNEAWKEYTKKFVSF